MVRDLGSMDIDAFRDRIEVPDERRSGFGVIGPFAASGARRMEIVVLASDFDGQM